VIKNGYAVIIQNASYKEKDIGSYVSSNILDDFCSSSSFKTALYTALTAAVIMDFFMF